MAAPSASAHRVAPIVVAVVAVSLAATGCQPHRPAPAPAAAPAPTLRARLDLGTLAGPWQWTYFAEADGLRRLERERWQLGLAGPASDPSALLTGRYRRDVLVLAVDGVPFQCSQAPWYRQRADYDVRVEAHGDELVVTETGYRTEPSPCERGFRRLGSYHATLDRRGLRLRWTGVDGAATEQTLSRDLIVAPIEPLAPDDGEPSALGAARLTGPWRWTLHGADDDGDRRDEVEAWELAVGDDGVVSATYLRTVTTTSVSGEPASCAGGPSWRYQDRYTLRGRRDGSRITFEEIAVEAGQHPCLAATPERNLDAATGELDGDWLVLTWRGKRRQVLHRP